MTFKLSDINLDRALYLYDQFHQESSEELTRNLLKLDSSNTEDIYLIINSYGGSVYALMAIIDTINSLKSKVNTVCLGIGASAGAVLFSIGNKRYIGENSKLMFHQVSTFAYGTIDNIENDLAEAKELNQSIFNKVLEKSKISNEELTKIFSKDSYLSAAQSVTKGFADDIIEVEQEIEDKAYEMVKSFQGAFRDEAYFAITASKFNNSTSLLKKITSDIKNNKKGDKSMNLEELKAELAKHNVDVDAMTNELKASKETVNLLNEQVEAKDAEIQNLKTEKEASLKQQREDKLNSILNKLIEDGKSTQDMNNEYKEMFEGKTLEQVEKFVAKLPVIIKTQRKSVDTNGVESDNEASDNDKVYEAIKAIAEEKKVAFDVAATEYYNNRKEK
jgi:ATP-dependent Clp protease protease subunit